MIRRSVSKGNAIMLALMLSITAFAGVPVAANETTSDSISWGIEYDWSMLGEDFDTLTGLNINEILDDVSEAADEAGFDLLIAEVTSGTYRAFVTQVTGDEVTITDANGNTHAVTEHITEWTTVNAFMGDMIIMMEWEDPDAGTDPETDEDPTQQGAGADIKLTGSAEQLFAIDGRYVEYRNADNELLGADSSFTGALSFGVGSAFDATFTGGDDEVDIDFEFDFSIGYELIDSQVEWRLHEPINAYNDLASVMDGDIHSVAWVCADDAAKDMNDEEHPYYQTHMEKEEGDMEFDADSDEWVETEGEETGRMMIASYCGEIEGTFASEISYDFSLMGVPVDLVGMDVDVFNIDIQDTYQITGDIDRNPILEDEDEGDFVCGDAIMFEQDPLESAADPTETYTVTIDDAGTQVEAHRVLAPPVPGCMVGALGTVMIASGMAIGEDADGIVSAIEPIFEDIEQEVEPTYGECPAEWDEDEMIDLKLHHYNDGWSECADRSDEPFRHLFSCEYSDTWYDEYDDEWHTHTWSHDIEFSSVNDGWEGCNDDGKILDEYVDHKFNCDNDHRDESDDGTDQDISLEKVNDGTEDCANGNDEADDTTLFYECDNGDMVEWWKFKANQWEACEDYSGNMDDVFCYVPQDWDGDGTIDETEEINWHHVANGWEDCEDGSDEPDDMAQCPSGYEWTSVNAFNDGKRNCWYENWEEYDYQWVTDEYYEQSYECHDGGEIEFYQVNDNINDCDDASDEEGFSVAVLFTCLDGTTIPVERVNDMWEDEDGQQHGGEDCPDGSDEAEEMEPTEELMNVFMHIGQSNIGETMENFGENLEEAFEDVAADEFPFLGADVTMLYDPITERTIGMLLFVDEDVDGDGEIDLDDERFIFIGPETVGYTKAPHALSFTYLVGSAAEQGMDETSDVDDISDVVNPDNHNTDGLDELDELGSASDAIDALENSGDADGDGVPDLIDQCQTTPSGANVGGDGCIAEESGTGDGTGSGTDDGDSNISDVRDKAEDAGLIPSVSLVATLGMLAIAGLVAARRD